VRPNDLERRLRARLDALGPTARADLRHVLMLPDIERVVLTWRLARPRQSTAPAPNLPFIRRAADEGHVALRHAFYEEARGDE
jgi:hypothetical protein